MAVYNDDEITDLTKAIGVLPVRDALPIPVGKIPTHATQIVNDGTVIENEVQMHQVTGGKTLYLTAFTLDIDNRSAAPAYVRLKVTNSVGNIQYAFASISTGLAVGNSMSLALSPPLEIPATFKIFLQSAYADVTARGFIHGYEL